MITSRLSTLLVRDGLVPVKKMELAFQRQVIYGGALDTVLLEMGALHEDRLWHYLSLASGLPVAELDMLEYIDPRGAQVCPREIAEQFQVAPLGLFGEALRLLVMDPVDLRRLEDLATTLGVPIQPFVVPEFRFHLVVERLFGVPVAPRFGALARQRSQPTRRNTDDSSVVVEASLRRSTQPFGRSGPTGAPATASPPPAPEAPAPPSAPGTHDGAAPAASGRGRRRTGDTWPGGSRPRLPGLPPEERLQTLTTPGGMTSVRSLGQPPPSPTESRKPAARTGRDTVVGGSRSSGGEHTPVRGSARPSTPLPAREPAGLKAARGGAADEADEITNVSAPPTPDPAPTPPSAPSTPAPPQAPPGPEAPRDQRSFLASLGLKTAASSKSTLVGFSMPRGGRAGRPDAAPQARDTRPFQVTPQEGLAAGEVESAEEAAVREARGLGLAADQHPDVSPDEHAREAAAEARPPTTTGPGPGRVSRLYAEDERTEDQIVSDQPRTPSAADRAELLALEREMAEAGAMEDVVHDAEGGGHDDAAGVPMATPPEATERVPSPWRGSVTLDPSPLDLKLASELLLGATDRDSIFHALLRAARSLGTGAALFLIQGDAAIGKLAVREGDVDDAAVAAMRLPIADVPVFAQALETRTLAVGLIDGPGQAALSVLGARAGVATTALPLVLRDRVVALVLVHRGDRAMTLAAAAPLGALGTEASLALSRLIVRAKDLVRAHLAQPDGSPVAVPASLVTFQPDAEPADSDRRTQAFAAVSDDEDGHPDALGGGDDDRDGDIRDDDDHLYPHDDGDDDGDDDDADAPAHDGGAPPRLDARAADPRTTGTLFDDALDGDDDAVAILRTRGAQATRVLAERFPGPLHDDRFQGLIRPLTASQHGPLLELAARLGADITAPALLAKLTDDDHVARYYAAFLAAEVRDRSLLAALVECAFDPDKSVRAVALDSLLFYRAREVDRALVPLRQALRDDPPRVRAAAYALEKLRDVSAIPELISALDVGGATAEECRRALVELTKEDFGTKARKWQSWWEANQDRSRIEWMLDGLQHPEDRIRLSASEELRRLTGEHFGYIFDLPRRERDEAHERWQTWWRQTGRDKFLGPTRRT